MKETKIKVGDYLTFVDSEGKDVCTEIVEEIFSQYGAVQIKCKKSTYDHHFWGLKIVEPKFKK